MTLSGENKGLGGFYSGPLVKSKHQVILTSASAWPVKYLQMDCASCEQKKVLQGKKNGRFHQDSDAEDQGQ